DGSARAGATASATRPAPTQPPPTAEPTKTPRPKPTAIPPTVEAAPAVLRFTPVGRVVNTNLTFYDCYVDDFWGAMYNGTIVYEGAAACSWDLSIGTRFRILGDPTARIYRCDDRGLLANTWVDIFFFDPADGWRWQAKAGRCGTIEIVSLQ